MVVIQEGLIYKNPDYEKDVIKSAVENHIWINALMVKDPKEIGRIILKWLSENERLINTEVALIPNQKELVVRINVS